jgi:histidyl-tRNA synthetase
MNDSQPIETDSYKGVRDFYPDDLRRREYLEQVMRQTVEAFGYEAIDASVLEPAELYDAKSGEELAQEQSYRFTDRGGRDIMLRPEMTPTVARMISARAKSLSFPARWYSIANVFRYERPQHGRLREHWQLNADIFGADSLVADLEVIILAHELMKNLGAKEDDFIIKLSSRGLFTRLCEDVLEIDQETQADLARTIDKKSKIDKDSFNGAIHDLLETEAAERLLTYLSAGDTKIIREKFPNLALPLNDVEELLEQLKEREIGNVVFEPALIRGLDYYTGSVFEVFDTHPQNNRSLFGGGRYDNLMDMFATEPVPAVGFGAGDVTLANFLEAHELWPELGNSLDVSICLVDTDTHAAFGYQVAKKLRSSNVKTRVDISGKGVGTQIKQADEAGAEFVTIIGDDEIESEELTFKKLATGEETTVAVTDLSDVFIDNTNDPA